MSLDNKIDDYDNNFWFEFNNYYSKQLKKENNFKVNLESDTFLDFWDEISIFKKIKIIEWNKLIYKRYYIFRKFVTQQDTPEKKYRDIIKLFLEYNKAWLWSEYLMYNLKIKEKLDKKLLFENTDKLQFYAIIHEWWKKMYNKIKANINNEIELIRESWDVIVKWKVIWVLSPATLEFKLFDFLLDNRWTPMSHENIIKKINPKRNYSKPYWLLCAEYKSNIPTEIKKLISSSTKWHYTIK